MDRPISKKRLKWPMLGGCALVATGLAAVCWLSLNPVARSLTVDASKITVSTVQTAPFHDFIPLRGQVVPLSSIVLDAVQGGRVEEVLVEVGQHVAAGQKLIRLSDPSLELDAIARETQVIAQINGEQSQQLNFELTRASDARVVATAEYNIIRLGREVSRRWPLAQAGFMAREKLDQSADELSYQLQLRDLATDALQRDAVLIRRDNASIAETGERLSANLEAVKRQLDALTVRAPADGVLTALDAHAGEEKSRGQHLGQIDRDAGFKVTIQVDEFYLARVKTGQRVAVTMNGSPSSLWISKIYPQVKDRRFEVDLSWRGSAPAGLRRGEAVQGNLELGDDVPAVVLPAGAFLEASGGAWVFVVDRDGTSAMRRPVTLGRRTNEAVEVLGGLESGDRVVTSDYTGLERIDRLALSF